jgi:hypothetical protein
LTGLGVGVRLLRLQGSLGRERELVNIEGGCLGSRQTRRAAVLVILVRDETLSSRACLNSCIRTGLDAISGAGLVVWQYKPKEATYWRHCVRGTFCRMIDG